MTTSIDKLRAESEAILDKHRVVKLAGEVRPGYCDGPECDGSLPCRIRQVAEKLLRLAEWVEKERKRHAPSGPEQRCLACGLSGNCCGTFHAAERILAECAEEKK